MTTQKRRSAGRPAHKSDPPRPFATTLAQSTINTLEQLHKDIGRPRSEIIAKAIDVYARIHDLLKP